MVNIDKLAELLQVHTQAEAARILGVSRQYIGQLVRDNDLEYTKYKNYTAADPLFGKMSDADISRITGLSPVVLGYRRKLLGIPKWSELRGGHCPQCVTNEYARGYCKACWERSRRKVRPETPSCPECGSQNVVHKWRRHSHTYDCRDCYHRFPVEIA